MATILEASPNAEWRKRLQRASFGGAVFHVEQQARNSGRRVVLHQYPKKNKPYSEDMGREAIRYMITGYIIGPNYHTAKAALISQLENSEGAQLIDPYVAPSTPILCICERYSVTETRERGGFCTFEMSFVELGQPGNMSSQQATQSNLQNKAADAGNNEVNNLNVAAQQVAPTTTPSAVGVQGLPGSPSGPAVFRGGGGSSGGVGATGSW